MRLIVKKYDETEDMYVAETSDDGATMRVLRGVREVGARISVYIEFMCDETETGADRAIEALSWLQEEVTKRKSTWTAKKQERAAKRERTRR